MEQRWSPTNKRIVVIGGVIVAFLFVNSISSILPQFIITLILAYILSPIADFFSSRLRLNRTLVVVIIYLALVAILIIVPVLLVPPLIAQIENFIAGLPELIEEIGEFIEKPLVFRDFTLDLQDLYDQASRTIEGFLSSLATQTVNILSGIASALIWTVFILVASFYLVKDSAVIIRWLEEVIPPPYRHDACQLRLKIAASWNAFLRGQLILCVTMGLIVGTTMALIGLPYAWFIGLLFGILEFVPNLGPTIASVPTVLIAFFQGSTILDISNGWFTLLVIGINIVLQQLENNFLVPRIMGHSLNLHPLVVLVAAIIGAHLVGVLGILLAAPIVATLRVLVEYTYYRLLDMQPFPEAAEDREDRARAVTEGDAATAHASQPAAATESKRVE